VRKNDKSAVVEDDPFGMELVLEILKTHGFIAYETRMEQGQLRRLKKKFMI